MPAIDAMTPPQLLWPTTTTCSMPTAWTAKVRTLNALSSSKRNWLAMLRVTKKSPGLASQTSVSGTRESQHPIHKILGSCTFARCAASSGFLAKKSALQALFFCKMSLSDFMLEELLELVECDRIEARVEGARCDRQAARCVVVKDLVVGARRCKGPGGERPIRATL